ncbi:MAG: hypothetical protein KDH88_07760 [Chromatiales bacterium]|nr:hypothetical protein [Chromatiales bacterium]
MNRFRSQATAISLPLGSACCPHIIRVRRLLDVLRAVLVVLSISLCGLATWVAYTAAVDFSA